MPLGERACGSAVPGRKPPLHYNHLIKNQRPANPLVRVRSSRSRHQADNMPEPPDAQGEDTQPLLRHSENGSLGTESHRGSGAGDGTAADHKKNWLPPDMRAQYALMASYGLAAWAWRSWEFAVALLLIDLYPESLLMVSVYGITDNLVRVVLGSQVGSFIGKRDLLPGATAMFLTQNVCIGASAGSALMLLMPRDVPLPTEVYWSLLVLMVVVGALSSVGSSGVRIAVEVEAVTALAAGDSHRLSTLNAGFRAIDLVCLLGAPLLVGVVMTWLGPAAGTVLLAAYTLVAWLPEITLLTTAVAYAPVLRDFKVEPAAPAASTQPVGDKEEETDPLIDPEAADGTQQGGETSSATTTAVNKSAPGAGAGGAGRRSVSKGPSSLSVYLHHPVLLPNLALALLYCTVLSLGFLMTGYLQWTGLSSAEVSMYRGVGAVTGLVATALYPSLHRWLGVVATGALGIFSQLACLALGVAPVALAALGQPGGPGALQPSPALVRALVAGVVASRMGLWTFNLAVTQEVQERVPKQQLSVVMGVQSSLQACFETLSFLAGVYLHDPRLFYWLMLGSVGVVTTAALLYAKHAVDQGMWQRRQQQQPPGSAVTSS